MEISIRKLEQARKMYFAIRSAREQIAGMYYAVHSVDLSRVPGSGNASASDPTAQTVYAIEDARERLAIVEKRFYAYERYVRNRIQPDDPGIWAIISMRYFLGRPWKDCGGTVKAQKIKRYLEENAERLNADESE